jgi:steroid 5-alpha reductase family enzyme
MNLTIYIDGIFVIVILASLTWVLSLFLKDVSIVDSAWSLMFLAAGIYYFQINITPDLKTIILFEIDVIKTFERNIHLISNLKACLSFLFFRQY